ncbi:hypothetical protein ACHAXR_008076 [Thalassiosira sp. AJA248-18]
MKTASLPPTVIICPGNGCSQIRRSNWYGRLYDILTQKHNIQCICEDFPDPLDAKRDIWVPHMRSLAEKHTTDTDPNNIILVGHSSGAQAALRYAELYPVHGIVLVSATYSDLGDAHERASGYYPQPKNSNGEETNPYLFDEMRCNCNNWHQFHSDDDPFIPLHEAERIRDGLGLKDTYYMLPGRSHYFDYSPELLDVVLSLC